MSGAACHSYAGSLAVEAWQICISGFLQSEANPTGIRQLWGRLRAKVEGPACRVELRSWCQNWSDLAELIWSFRPDPDSPSGAYRPTINIFGYSWGGYSATLLARELDRRGMSVDCIVLADAVYRHWYKLGQWRAFAPWSTIEVPRNVQRVEVFRQANPRFRFGRAGGSFQPAGHRVIAKSKLTRIVEHPLLSCEHNYADDDADFRWLCLKVAGASVD